MTTSSVLVVLFERGLFRADIIYAESDEIFREIDNLTDLRDKRIVDFGFYDIIAKPLRVYRWGDKIPGRGYYTNYSGNLFIYFLRRIKKFRGISPEKIILHLKETEWRLNKISKNEKVMQKLEANIDPFSLISKDMCDELLGILRTNPL